MFQAFLLFCSIGEPASLESCYLEASNNLFATEEGCYIDLEARLEILSSEVFDFFYIEEYGCHSYLKENNSI